MNDFQIRKVRIFRLAPPAVLDSGPDNPCTVLRVLLLCFVSGLILRREGRGQRLDGQMLSGVQ